MKRSAMVFGAGLLLATAPEAMAQGPQRSDRAPTLPRDAAPAVPGQVTTSTGGATPGETSPSVRPPRPGQDGSRKAGAGERPRGRPAHGGRSGSDAGTGAGGPASTAPGVQR